MTRDTGGAAGRAFTQTGGEREITCYNCREKGLSVNDCPKLDEADEDKFWDAFNKTRRNQPKMGFMRAAVAGQRADMANAPAPASAPAPAPVASVAGAPAPDTSEEFEQLQRYMARVKVSNKMSLSFTQVGTVTEKKVSFASVEKKMLSVLR